MTNDQNEGTSLALQDTLPSILVDARDSGGLEAAVHHALGAAGLRQQIVAIFLLPQGATPPSWSAIAALRDSTEAVDGLMIDTRAHEVFLHGKAVPLTVKEFALLHCLYEHRGALLTRAKLLREVWGESYGGGPRTVDVHIRRLRAKLGAEWFETTRGLGYKFRRSQVAPPARAVSTDEP